MQQRSKCNTALHRSLLLCLLIACSSPAQELFAPSVSIGANSQNAVAAYQRVKQAADSAFSTGHHRKAYDTYLTLARLGDQFSQYRIAFMLQNGMGVPRDLTKALAWAYVAAEKRTQPALDQYESIKAAMSDEQWQAAEPLAMQYLKDYGVSASSRRAYNIIRRQLRQCTGSRLGARCDRVYASSMNCNTASQGMPGESCLVMGLTGLPGVQRMQPATIRRTQENLLVLIENYNPGRVEFGEFQVLEDNDDEAPPAAQMQYKPRTFTIDGFVDEDDEEPANPDENDE